jgi:ABC-2 type transport system ATP-binding protein
MALIEATHLRKHFGNTLAVDDVSLAVEPGRIYGLVGSDGAGKTTTLRLLVGALKPDSGEVLICGCNVNRQAEQARAKIGYLSQRFSMYEDLTVLENIRFFAEVRGLTAAEWQPRCMEILDFVGLAGFKDRLAGQLSGGMKQKLGLASAMVTRPQVLLLDEPTTGVDPVTRQDFWQLVIRLASSHINGNDGTDVAVIITTPYMDEASRCHRIGFMKDGRLLIEGSPAELRATLDGRILDLTGKPLQELRWTIAEHPDVEDVRAFGGHLHLRVRPGRAQSALKDIPDYLKSRGLTLADLRIVPPVLEDVFIALAGE